MILLTGSSLTLADVAAIADRRANVALAPDAGERVHRARAIVDRKAAGDEPIYGINTGFGALAETAVPREALDQLQVNLLRSHAAGVGEPLSTRVVRATMGLRANVLAKGFSGIRRETLERLIEMLNRGVHPKVPSRGASGDLAPLAHLALVLIGEGEAALGDSPEWLPGDAALRAAGLTPAQLGPKEGLALINGTQPSVAVAALAHQTAERLARAADVAVALSVDALRGSVHPFDARIHAARPHAGQSVSAANVRLLLEGSGINKSHEHCGRVQDAYSLRCAAQVHGAARDALSFVGSTLTIEANGATDNPMVFADEGEIVSGGNFHGAPVAMAADLLVMAAAQLATISERRSDRLVNPVLSELPAFLTPDGGGTGVGDQDPRPSGECGHDSDLREPRRPRQHEYGRGAQGGTRRRLRRASDGRGNSLRLPGDRPPRAADDVAAPAAGARLRACGRAAPRRRSAAGAGHRANRRDDC
jgi:histidine ammonia-lyase